MSSAGDAQRPGNDSCVVVGAAGVVGRSFAAKLVESGWLVIGIDLCAKPKELHSIQWFSSDAGQLAEAALDAIGKATTVVAALPMKQLLDCAPRLLSVMQPGSLFIETSSVKEAVWQELLPMTGHVEAVGINPMFSPALGFNGRPIAWCVIRPGPREEQARKVVTAWGSVIVEVDAEEHDRATSVCQALVHSLLLAFGEAVRQLGTSPDLLQRLSTPLSNTMFALLARLASGSAATCWEIQHDNPRAVAARKTAETSLRELSSMANADDEGRFCTKFLEASEALGKSREHYEQQALAIFATIGRENRAALLWREP